MLPNIRAVIAAMAAAITLLVLAFGVVATLRVAQESRAGSLHADLARRGQAAAAEPQPVMVIETPGPTLLAKAPEVEALRSRGRAGTGCDRAAGHGKRAGSAAGRGNSRNSADRGGAGRA